MSNPPKIYRAVERPGYDALWLWFDLSRSSYCVMPRAFMHAMPDEWQAKMADLLNQWDEAWNWGDDIDHTRIQCVKNGKLVSTPDYIINYRHPDREKIESMRKSPALGDGK